MSGIEEYKRLDIRYLQKNRLLTPGRSSPLSWSCGGVNTGSIRIKAEMDYLVLTYRYTRYDESEDVEEQVPLAWTGCNYGGKRPWFLCPRCGRRVAVLVCAGKLFLCRHCYQLKFSSQLETDMDRAHRKAGKLRERLGEHWRRPKGMHQRTYSKLLHRLTEAEMQVDEIFTVKAAKFLARSPSFRQGLKGD